jgi:uncharacterized protein (DUF1697 family)
MFVALLRGINVGGRNPIRMTDLKACFERHGFREVETYIQSGNVLFQSSGSPAALAGGIEQLLNATFGYGTRVVVRTQRQLQAIVERAPEGFGAQPSRFRYDVIFLKPPLTAAAALRTLPVREGVDSAAPGSGVLYCSRLISQASQSRLSRIVSTPIYQHVTIRNWNTTVALLRLMERGS